MSSHQHTIDNDNTILMVRIPQFLRKEDDNKNKLISYVRLWVLFIAAKTIIQKIYRSYDGRKRS